MLTFVSMKNSSAENLPTIKKSFPVLNMSCASCAASAQSMLESQEGVKSVSVNYANESAIIDYDPAIINPGGLKSALQSIGYDLLVDEDASVKQQLEQSHFKKLKFKTIGALALSVPIVVTSMFYMEMPFANYLMLILSTPVVFFFGKQFFIGAYKQAKFGKANMDTLVALSTGIAYFFSLYNTLFPQFFLSRGLQPHVYYEAAAVIIGFILLGKLLEEGAKGKTSSAIKKLMGMQPTSVTIIRDKAQETIPIQSVKKGDLLLVKPGERIPVDGILTDGNSYVDESMISGEPMAIKKIKGDKVFAGTINQKGSFTIEAKQIGSETKLAYIIKLVQEAQGSRAPVQKLVDKIAGIFVPIVIGIAILSFMLWFIFGQDNAFTYGLLAFITVLVIACPCALGLATPTALMAGIGKGAENGILIKDAESLELAKKINVIILDKTGTITEGKPKVTDMLFNETGEKYLPILIAMEKHSEHPLAEAIVKHFPKEDSVPIRNFRSITGKGVEANYEDKIYYAGNKKLLAEFSIEIPAAISTKTKAWLRDSKTVVYFFNQQTLLSVIAISDKIKPGSATAIQQLKQSGIEIYMLTGDNNETAAAIAKLSGIEQYRSGLLPEEKGRFVEQLQKEGKVVAMVGDGINDSHALAKADVSIAMGKGSDIAMDVANMTIISSNLLKVPQAIQLSKKTVKTIRQNLFWAFIYNTLGIPVAAGILYPFTGFLLNPMIAGMAMAFSSISVVSNSLRLKWLKLDKSKME